MSESSGYVSSRTEAGVCTIEFFHPAANSLPSDLLAELGAAIDQAATSPEARVIVLRSGGTGAFCAGASFEELSRIRTEAEGSRFFGGFARVIAAMRRSPKFIVARVQGKAVGGGVGLVAAADYVFALSAASVRLSELAIGIGPFVIGPAVERRIGPAAFSELAIDAGAWRTSQWAQQHGLYQALPQDTAALDEAVSKLATELAGRSPGAVREIRAMLWQGTEHWEALMRERAQISGRLATGAEAAALIRAAIKK